MIKQIILLSAGIALGSSAWAGSVSSSINEQLSSVNSSNLMVSENMQQLASHRPGHGGSQGAHHNNHGDGAATTKGWKPKTPKPPSTDPDDYLP